MNGILNQQKGNLFFFAKTLLFCSILTGVLLLILSFALYQFGWGEKAISISVIFIYVAVTFFGGWMVGSKMEKRKFLWGLFMGILYYLLLALVSVLTVKEGTGSPNFFLTTFVLCGAGGMLGGMLAQGK